MTKSRVEAATRRPAGARVIQMSELLHPLARAMRWSPLAVAAGVAVSIVFAMTRDTCLAFDSPCISTGARVTALRVAMLVLAMGAAFALDDPTEETGGHLPTPLWLRRAGRVLLLSPALAACWMALVLLALRDSVDGTAFPTAGLTLELVTTMVVGFALTAVGARFAPDRTGGVVAGPALAGLAITALYLPQKWTPLVADPLDPNWGHAHVIWRGALAVGLAVFILVSRDPWHRPVLARGRRAS